ncbi:MAG: alpha-hydroxy acid oxidase [Thermoplasmata archaeon]
MGLALINLLELEERARAKISRSAFEYIAGGSEDEVSLRRNREAFRRWAIRPRVLVDVSKRDTTVDVLGEPLSMPILVAPTAFHRLVHDEGEVATAQGTEAAQTLYVASTLSTRSLEAIAAVGPSPRWFQLYVYKDRDVSASLIRRAEAAGYRALCLTVDTPQGGRREQEEREAFSLPPGLGLRNFEGEGMDQLPPPEEGTSGLTAYWSQMLDPSLSWEDLEWVRSVSRLPLVLKGIMTAEDAVMAVEFDVEGIVVSNHGGRQLDGTLGTLDALPEVVEAVAGKAEVYVDGGVRRGTDVLKALALGARAVLIGRPILYGLALDGAAGVQAVLEHLREELDLAMALSGVATLRDIGPTLLQDLRPGPGQKPRPLDP